MTLSETPHPEFYVLGQIEAEIKIGAHDIRRRIAVIMCAYLEDHAVRIEATMPDLAEIARNDADKMGRIVARETSRCPVCGQSLDFDRCIHQNEFTTSGPA